MTTLLRLVLTEELWNNQKPYNFLKKQKFLSNKYNIRFTAASTFVFSYLVVAEASNYFHM